jgi:hypothetical protein
MSRIMTRTNTYEDTRLLDAEAWDMPRRLSDEDLHDLDLNAGDEPGWRSALGLFDPEDAR